MESLEQDMASNTDPQFWRKFFQESNPGLPSPPNSLVPVKKMTKVKRLELQKRLGAACLKEDAVEMLQCIQEGADPSAHIGALRAPPLMWFAWKENFPLMELLLQNGANPDVWVSQSSRFKYRYMDEMTPMQIAFALSSKNMVELLLQYHAKTEHLTTINGRYRHNTDVAKPSYLFTILRNNDNDFRLWCLDKLYQSKMSRILQLRSEEDFNFLNNILSYCQSRESLPLLMLIIRQLKEMPLHVVEPLITGTEFLTIIKQKVELSETYIVNLWRYAAYRKDEDFAKELVNNNLRINLFEIIFAQEGSMDDQGLIDDPGFMWNLIQRGDSQFLQNLLRLPEVVEGLNKQMVDSRLKKLSSTGLGGGLQAGYKTFAYTLCIRLHVNTMELLLKSGVRLDWFRDELGQTILHHKAMYSNFSLGFLEAFQKNGMEEVIHAVDNKKRTIFSFKEPRSRKVCAQFEKKYLIKSTRNEVRNLTSSIKKRM